MKTERLPRIFTKQYSNKHSRQRFAAGLGCILAVLGSLRAERAQGPVFSDDFTAGKLDATKWEVATYRSPDSKAGINNGTYVADAIDFATGMLRIKVTQQERNGVVQSLGGAIISKDRFSYGTYEFTMRMSTTADGPNADGKTLTGAVSSAFLYYNNSESEIDLEFLGNENAIYITNWQNPTSSHAPKGDVKQADKVNDEFLGTRFRDYRLVWLPDSVKVYIDGTLVTTHDQHVPTAPAHIIIQHRGTNSKEWGGMASVGVTRYLYVRNVKFTPLDR